MKQNIKTTLLSLVITFTILFPITSFTTIKILENNPNKIKNNMIINKTKYNIPKEQELTILLVVLPTFEIQNKKNPYPNNKNSKGTEEKYFVIKISAHKNRIILLNIPKNFKTIAQSNDGTPMIKGTLEKIYNSNGITQLKNSIENILSIEIDKTIRVDYNAISGIINHIGGIKIIENKKNEKKYKTISNENFIKILNKTPINALLLLKENLNKKNNLDNLFISLSNLAYSDITVYDFESKKTGFEKMIESKNTKLILPNLKIKTVDNRNKLTKQSEEEIKKLFS